MQHQQLDFLEFKWKADQFKAFDGVAGQRADQPPQKVFDNAVRLNGLELAHSIRARDIYGVARAVANVRHHP